MNVVFFLGAVRGGALNIVVFNFLVPNLSLFKNLSTDINHLPCRR